MKIAYCHELTESAPGAGVARLLAERVGDTVACLQLDENLAPPATVRARRRGRDAVPSERKKSDAAAVVVGRGRSGNASGEGSEVIRHASPACTRLIVTPRFLPAVPEEGHMIERLALATRVPTLVPHDPARIQTWLEGGRPLRLLCAHDLTATADEALRFVRQLLDLAPCEIILAHVHRSVEQLSHPGCAGVGSMRSHDLEMRALLEGKLRERARAILGERKVTTRVSPAPFRRDDFILELQRETDADLVVTPLHPQGNWAAAHANVATSRTLLSFGRTNLILVPGALARATVPRAVIRRVLIVADLGTADVRVGAQARSLLGPGGMLHLLHVVHPHAVGSGEGDRLPGFRQRMAAHFRLVESSRERLRALAQGEAEATGAAVTSEIIEHRDRDRAIAEAAKRFDAEIVCLAMDDPPTFFSRLLGSRMRRIQAKTGRPVLVVQPPPP